MAVLTIQQQLEEVQTAISEILANGQSYAFGNRMTTRADLKVLEAREVRLRARYEKTTYGRARNLARFDSPN